MQKVVVVLREHVPDHVLLHGGDVRGRLRHVEPHAVRQHPVRGVDFGPRREPQPLGAGVECEKVPAETWNIALFGGNIAHGLGRESLSVGHVEGLCVRVQKDGDKVSLISACISMMLLLLLLWLLFPLVFGQQVNLVNIIGVAGQTQNETNASCSY